MRGIGHTLSRLPTARALIAGAAILAGALTSAAYGQTSGSRDGNGTQAADSARSNEVAFAVPRVPHDGAVGVAFPQPLRPSDVALMKRVFAFQDCGDIPDAIKVSADLDDTLLMGSVLADRYLGRYHRSSTSELTDWLAKYGDDADAPAIHALLLTKLPKGATAPPAPETVALVRPSESQAEPEPEDIDPPRNDLQRNPVLDRTVRDRAGSGKTASALRLITVTRGISRAYAAQLRAEVARVLFTRNEDGEALRVARVALSETPTADQPALGFYVGGLAAWRLGQIDVARSLFQDGAEATSTSPRLHAASAFWASRASRAMHDPASTVRWLHVAAQERLTLHGLLARRILRMNTGIMPSGELVSQADVDAVAATPHGRRAFALLQVGQPNRAEAELRMLWGRIATDPVFARSLMMVASAAGLPECAADMATALQEQDGLSHDELRFPMPRLRPAGGFSIDPPLVYALTRLESNFDSTATSPVGARGLMQIMPATARYISGDLFNASARLDEPAVNLAIGQRYVAYLSRLDGVGDDLLRVLASYNSGPGNFARWGADMHDQDDPLLFLEAIPIPETRNFVRHVLVYSWVYAARMHLPSTSLDALSAGEFPRFTPHVSRRRIASAAAAGT